MVGHTASGGAIAHADFELTSLLQQRGLAVLCKVNPGPVLKHITPVETIKAGKREQL
jgi:hypothetical protein